MAVKYKLTPDGPEVETDNYPSRKVRVKVQRGIGRIEGEEVLELEYTPTEWDSNLSNAGIGITSNNGIVPAVERLERDLPRFEWGEHEEMVMREYPAIAERCERLEGMLTFNNVTYHELGHAATEDVARWQRDTLTDAANRLRKAAKGIGGRFAKSVERMVGDVEGTASTAQAWDSDHVFEHVSPYTGKKVDEHGRRV